MSSGPHGHEVFLIDTRQADCVGDDSFNLTEGTRIPGHPYTLRKKISGSGASEVWWLDTDFREPYSDGRVLSRSYDVAPAGQYGWKDRERFYPALKILTEVDEGNIECLNNEIGVLQGFLYDKRQPLLDSEVHIFAPGRGSEAWPVPGVPRLLRDLRDSKLGGTSSPPGFYGFVKTGHRGVTLDEFARTNLKLSSIAFADWFTLMRCLLRIVDALHTNGILHRDLKPQNVLINRRTTTLPLDALNMCVIDYGIATQVGQSLNQHPQGKFLRRASAGYSPPEAKETDEIFRQSYDIFGVGAIGDFLLTRRHPKRNSELPLDPRRHISEVEIEVAQWVMDCTQPDPIRRFQSVKDALEKLESISSRLGVLDEGAEASRWGSLSEISKQSGMHDIVIIMDSTESMIPHRESLRNEFSFFANTIFEIYEDLQVTVIHLGDYAEGKSGTSSKARPNPLRWRTSVNSEELEEELLMEYVAMGGGDDAEAWEWAFSHLARVHKWRKDTNRVILSLGDSFSHGFAHRRPFIEMEKFSHFAELHELGEMPYCFYDYLHKGWELDDIEDNYREGVQYIDNPSPMMRKLHKDPKTGRVTRPSITKQIRRIMETSSDDSPITIHSIRCGDNNISLKFMQYLSIEGGGFSLDASEVEYLVPTLLGLLLSEDSENFLSFYENFEHAFVDVSTDLFTQSLGPVTQYVTKMV